MRRRPFALCAVLTVCLTGCAAVDSGPRVEGLAPTGIPWSGPTYVEDWQAVPRERPDLISMVEGPPLDRLAWRDWGSPRATATGYVIDLDCLPQCADDGPPSYRVRVVLSGLVKRQYAAYYSHASVTAVRPPAPDWAVDYSSLPLHVPAA
ncbi:hypothetical protein RB628_24715 [Streptomyces sp. ADMS]|uniref:hypothetical protein n=1 Tax=Streptomyces sp. ADMS TaxID=3071415 RepID=UPI00296F0095|nr:hypothetical protein [Streptomyces sp. ADMS]MDW4908453.1 hypothetical protein [Streptomyces sp. ADMS]